MGATENMIRESVHAHLLPVLSSLRQLLSIEEAVDSLLINAGRWKSDTSGSPTLNLDELDPHATHGSERHKRIDPILRREQDWLRACGPEEWREYAKLLTGYSGNERTTSGSLIDVVATAFLAYGQESTPNGPIEMFDPACGIGGLALSVLERLGGEQPLRFCGQDINNRSAQCARANALLRGVDASVYCANTLLVDGFPDQSFTYAVAEPPFGMPWTSVRDDVAIGATPTGRFPGGLPEINDSSLLFTQLLVGKLRAPADGGGRAVVLMAPRPLWSVRSGAVRSWLLREDLLEAVIALPEGLSNSTGIRLYALVLSNIKTAARKRRVQFIDLRGFYEDASGRGPRRRVSAAGLQELSRSIGRLSGSATSRTVDVQELYFRQVRVTHRGRAAREDASPDSAPALRVFIPASIDLVEWSEVRYRAALPDVREDPGPDVPLLGMDRVMQSRQHNQLLRTVQSLQWPTTRLAELISLAAYVRSAKAPERTAAISAVAGAPAVMVPVEPHLAAVAGDPGTVAPDSRIMIIQLDESLADTNYVVGFLNSPLGRQARLAAVGRGGGEGSVLRSVSSSDAWRLADETLIALPPLDVQKEIARAETALDSAVQRLADDRLRLWREPAARSAILRQARRLAPSGDLTEWLSTLPFPMAAPLWAYASMGGNVHARHKQMFLCWEAAIEFHAAVLLSGLAQDGTRLSQESAHLAKQLAAVGLSPARSTLGVWQNIIQRLSKVFRDHLTGSDTDEQARVRTAFAEPPQDVLDLLLSAEIVQLFSRAISLRNTWSGHPGATGEETLRDQLEVMTGHLQTLRNVTNDAWLGFPLVRAGASQFRKGIFRHDIELAMGANTPFRQEQVPTTSAMEMNNLYFVSLEAGRTLPLAPLIQLRPDGFGRTSSCYCYNRVQADGVRLVSYHDTTAPEITEGLDLVSEFVQVLSPPERAEEASSYPSAAHVRAPESNP